MPESTFNAQTRERVLLHGFAGTVAADMKVSLDAAGYSAHIAGEADEISNTAVSLDPCFLLMAASEPTEETVLEVCVQLKAQDTLQSLCLVLIGDGTTSSRLRTTCLELGAEDFMAELPAASELVARMEIHSRNRANQQQFSKLRTLFESSRDAIFVFGEEGLIDYNRATMDLFGWTSEEDFKGRQPYEFSPPKQRDGEDTPVKAKRYLELAIQGKISSFEWCHSRPDGSLFDCEIRLSPVQLWGERCLLAIVRDISESKKLEAELKRAEERDRLARKLSGVGVWEWNPETDEIYWSDEVFEIFGFDRRLDEADLATVSKRIHPDDYEAWEADVTACLEGKKQHSQTFRLLHPDGSVRWIAAYGDVYREENGKAILMAGVAMDVTERKIGEHRLERLSKVLRSIRDINQLIIREEDPAKLLDGAIEVLIGDGGFQFATTKLLDSNGQACHTSEANSCKSEKELEFVRAQICCDSTISEFNPDGWQPTVSESSGTGASNWKCMCGILQHEGILYGQLRVGTSPETMEIEEEVTLFKEICDDLGYALYNLFLEEQKEDSYRQMIRAKNEAEEANRSKDEFLAVMNHELRTPLNPIMGYAQIMQADAKGEDYEMLTGILDSSERMLGLIDMILEFSSLDRSEIEPKQEPFNLYKACLTAFSELKPLTKGLNYKYQNGDSSLEQIDRDLIVAGDRDMLLRVLENILQNACKYTHEGSITFSFGRLTGRSGEDHYRFIVSDTGIGMDKESSEKLFDAFAQADSSYSRSYDGMGLGLAICKKLIDIMKGQISVTSELGKGSSFMIDLPIKAYVPEPSSSSESKPPASGSRQFSRPLEILVVDDEPDNAELAKLIIKKLKGTSVTARDGREAVSLCAGRTFDVILMDLRMPDIDGFQTFELIRTECESNRETPVIPLTANVSAEVRLRCEEIGMHSFLEKPMRVKDLLDAVESVIN